MSIDGLSLSEATPAQAGAAEATQADIKTLVAEAAADGRCDTGRCNSDVSGTARSSGARRRETRVEDSQRPTAAGGSGAAASGTGGGRSSTNVLRWPQAVQRAAPSRRERLHGPGCLFVTIGLSWLSIPFASTFGLLAGLLAFIPNIGSIASSLPAIVLALSVDVKTALFVIAVYWRAHFIDDFLGLADRRAAHRSSCAGTDDRDATAACWPGGNRGHYAGCTAGCHLHNARA